MTTEWRVVANYWKANSGWTHEEEVDSMADYMDAEMYVNSLDESELKAYFNGGADAVQFDIYDEDGNKVSDFWVDKDDLPMDEVVKSGIITTDDFCKAVAQFGFDSPVVTALWNTMENNPNNADAFETVYAMWSAGRFNGYTMEHVKNVPWWDRED